MTDIRTKGDMEAFANAGDIARPAPSGHALVRQTHGVPERIIGAQPVAVYRDDQRILQKISALAAAAGSDWMYRFPVRNRQTGQTEHITGPSIKLALAVASLVGNNQIEIREIDVGDAWVFYARYTDIETGFSLERAFRQRKGQQTMKTKDADRSLDIVYQIGQSKAIRNVIVNSCGIFCDFAFEQAENSLVQKIGKDLVNYRKRTIDGIARMPCELIRVERVIGRAAKDWTAPDIARIVAMMQSVADGMATAEDVFPPEEKEETKLAKQTNDPGPEKTSAPVHEPLAQQDGGGAAEPETDHATAEQKATAAEPVIEKAEITAAWQRGKDDKANGAQRRAMPGEYRGNSKLFNAWQDGYDGMANPAE